MIITSADRSHKLRQPYQLTEANRAYNQMRLQFNSEKGVLSWLRSRLGYGVRTTLVAEETWNTPCILIVTEGNSVSVYADKQVIVKLVDRPVCETLRGIDLSEKLLQHRIGRFWEEVYRPAKRRLTFWTDSRPIRDKVITGLPRLEVLEAGNETKTTKNKMPKV